MEISHYRHPKLHSSHSVTEHCFPYVTNSCFESVKHENVFRALINALALSFIYSFIYLLIYLFIYLFIYLPIFKTDNEKRNTYDILSKKTLEKEKYLKLS